MISTPDTTMCGSTSNSYVPPRSVSLNQVTSLIGSCTFCTHESSHAALQSSRIFISEEVSRLAAALRRASTNCMYDDRWLGFAHWVVERGNDPTPGPTPAQIATFLVSSLRIMAFRLK